MVQINTIDITPPLLNSACAWSSDLAQLKALYNSPHTGAITTRTATLNGFKEDESHTVAFTSATNSSINSYGYSPHPLAQYLIWIEDILTTAKCYKPIIVSITSDVSDPSSLGSMISQIQGLRKKLNDQKRDTQTRIAVELNTSCPNIKNSPPPGYNFESLGPLLQVLSETYAQDPTLTIGLKLPPFVYEQQFHSVVNGIMALAPDSRHRGASTTVTATTIGAAARTSDSAPISTVSNGATGLVISFLTCTNTLGNTLLFADQSMSPVSSSTSNKGSSSLGGFALPTVLGGLAGEALHPLALGNVYRFSQILKGLEKHSALRMKLIGVGGVTSKEARQRMTNAGADAVACATLLGKEGLRAFETLS